MRTPGLEELRFVGRVHSCAYPTRVRTLLAHAYRATCILHSRAHPIPFGRSDFLYTRGEIGGEMWVLIRGVVRLLPTHLTANYTSAELLQMPYLQKLENEGNLSAGALLQP